VWCSVKKKSTGATLALPLLMLEILIFYELHELSCTNNFILVSMHVYKAGSRNVWPDCMVTPS